LLSVNYVWQVAYFGRQEKVMEHFASVDMHCPPHYNPADFIRTILSPFAYLFRNFNITI